jgi:hypothetical protein
LACSLTTTHRSLTNQLLEGLSGLPIHLSCKQRFLQQPLSTN